MCVFFLSTLNKIIFMYVLPIELYFLHGCDEALHLDLGLDTLHASAEGLRRLGANAAQHVVELGEIGPRSVELELHNVGHGVSLEALVHLAARVLRVQERDEYERGRIDVAPVGHEEVVEAPRALVGRVRVRVLLLVGDNDERLDDLARVIVGNERGGRRRAAARTRPI